MISAEVISYITIIITIGFMLYFSYSDYNSFKDTSKVHKDFKSIIVSIGVLGTFTGIFIGLLFFDEKNIENSITELLAGLKIAFATSIMGMFLSISLSASQKKADEGEMENEIELLNSINKRLDSIKTNTSNTNLTFDKMTSILEQSKNMQIEKLDLLNTNLIKSLDKISNEASKTITESLSQIINRFNNNLLENFGKEFDTFNTSVIKMTEWQKRYKASIENSENKFNNIIDKLEETNEIFNNISQNHRKLESNYTQLDNILNGNIKLIETLKKELDTTNDFQIKFNQLNENFDELFNKNSEKLENILSFVAELVNSTKHTQEEIQSLGKTIPNSLSHLDNSLNLLTDKFAQDYNHILNEAIANLENIKQIGYEPDEEIPF